MCECVCLCLCLRTKEMITFKQGHHYHVYALN